MVIIGHQSSKSTFGAKGRFQEEKKVAVLLDFVQITPLPQFGQIVQLFKFLSDIQNDSLSITLPK